MGSAANAGHCETWNKGELAGQKAPFKFKDIWARGRLDGLLRSKYGADGSFQAMGRNGTPGHKSALAADS